MVRRAATIVVKGTADMLRFSAPQRCSAGPYLQRRAMRAAVAPA